ERLKSVAAAFAGGVDFYRTRGSPLYGALCEMAGRDPTVIELASHAQAGSHPPFHLFAAVQYLLSDRPREPMARYFPLLTDHPLSAEQAAPEFVRFCAANRAPILKLLTSRTVQTTYVERCKNILPPLSLVGRELGEPLHLIEIGCSAGVLL